MEDTKILTKQDFVSDQDVRWCPGCGDYAILSQIQKMFPNLGIPKENFLIVSGIVSKSSDIELLTNQAIRLASA